MSKRHGISGRKSKKLFNKTAGSNKVHGKNYLNNSLIGPMRGGIRL